MSRMQGIIMGLGKFIGKIVSAPIKAAAVVVGAVESTIDPYAGGPNSTLANWAEDIEDGTSYILGDDD